MSKPSLSDRLKAHLKEYGKIAACVYFAIFIAVYLGFLFSISTGLSDADAATTVGTAGAAWLATKVTQPLRIGATFLITPLVAKLIRRKPVSEMSSEG